MWKALLHNTISHDECMSFVHKGLSSGLLSNLYFCFFVLLGCHGIQTWPWHCLPWTPCVYSVLYMIVQYYIAVVYDLHVHVHLQSCTQCTYLILHIVLHGESVQKYVLHFFRCCALFVQAANPNMHSFSQSTVMSYSSVGPGGQPQMYQATTSTKTAPGGVRGERFGLLMLLQWQYTTLRGMVGYVITQCTVICNTAVKKFNSNSVMKFMNNSTCYTSG